MDRLENTPIMEAARPLALVATCALLATSLGCSEDEARRCVASLCDPATHGSVCVGHAVQTCASDGRSFVYAPCGAQQRCDAGACVPRTCTTLGRATCVSVTELERCKDDGSGFERIPCASGEVCKDGACVPSDCAGETDRCTTNGFLHCVDAAWVQENCPVGEICSLGEGGVARCNPLACTPETRRCEGSSARICDARGGVETIETCAGDAPVCAAGVCQPEVCGVTPGDTSDAPDADGAETEDAEPESRIVFTLNGVANTFDISAFATFDAGDRTVTVRASKSTRRIELTFSPANATVSGTFSSEIFNPVKVVVCYDTGQSPAPFEEFCEGFTHRSVAYEVEVTRNDGPGGRFEASFSATLEDENTDTIELLAGQINVQYR